MTDLIGRQDAITLPVIPKEHRDYQTQNLDDAYEQGWFDLQKCIKELPSARPERRPYHEEWVSALRTLPKIIRCKDCKYFEYDHPYVVYGVPVLGHLICNKWGDGCKTDENGFCFMAERRTDE